MDLNTLYEYARQFWVVWLAILVIAVFWYAFNPKNKKRFEEDAKIIFKDEENGG